MGFLRKKIQEEKQKIKKWWDDLHDFSNFDGVGIVEKLDGDWLSPEEYETLSPEEIEKREAEVIAELRERIKKL